MNTTRPTVASSEDLARVLRQAFALLAQPDHADLSLHDAIDRAAGFDKPLLDDAALVVTRWMRVPPGPPGGARSLRAALELWRHEHEGQQMPASLAQAIIVQALATL